MQKKQEQKQEKEKRIEVGIQPLQLKTIKVSIKGKTPLLMDRMSEEVKQAILDKQVGKTKSGKKMVRNIDHEVQEAIHKLPDGSVGFPSAGFKAGMIESTSFIGDKFFSKKLIRGIKIINAVNGLIPIKYKKQDVFQHNVGSNTKFTPQFHEWACELMIQFDMNNLSEVDIVKLINYAGFYYGIGIWSPRCKSGGDYGMYEVEVKKK